MMSDVVMNDISRFAAIGNACPVCNNEMELKARHPLDGSCKSSIEWYCNKHSEHEGKPTYDLIAALYFKDISYDQLMEIGEMVRGKRAICDLPGVEMELKIYIDEIGLSWASRVIEISKYCGIDITNHVHNNAFDIGTLVERDCFESA